MTLLKVGGARGAPEGRLREAYMRRFRVVFIELMSGRDVVGRKPVL